MNFLANSITMLALVGGFMSIIFSLEHHFTFACWAILLSVVFDGLDGQIARRNPVPSEFGKEIDSLVDGISFGIAPSVLGYIFIYQDFYLWATLALLVYLICSVFRLAKYNVTPKEKLSNHFCGLPTTVSGGVLASFVLIFRRKPDVPFSNFIPAIFLFIVLLLSFLMVSRVRYLNLDGLKQLFGKRVVSVVLFAAILLILAGYLGKAGTTLFVIFLLYLVFSPFFARKLV
ncbi:CDP-diacylglycerol--serine O-phosphatidyltransferase [Candidatus Omnitrophota bacterium]